MAGHPVTDVWIGGRPSSWEEIRDKDKANEEEWKFLEEPEESTKTKLKTLKVIYKEE